MSQILNDSVLIEINLKTDFESNHYDDIYIYIYIYLYSYVCVTGEKIFKRTGLFNGYAAKNIGFFSQIIFHDSEREHWNGTEMTKVVWEKLGSEINTHPHAEITKT